MTKYNLSFLELMRVVKEGDRVENSQVGSGTMTCKEGWFYWNDMAKGELWAEKDFVTNTTFRILKPEPKLVKWYRPAVIWLRAYKTPTQCRSEFFEPSKEAWGNYLNTSKVLEWETKEFPATWSECDEQN